MNCYTYVRVDLRSNTVERNGNACKIRLFFITEMKIHNARIFFLHSLVLGCFYRLLTFSFSAIVPLPNLTSRVRDRYRLGDNSIYRREEKKKIHVNLIIMADKAIGTFSRWPSRYLSRVLPYLEPWSNGYWERTRAYTYGRNN